MKQNKIVFQAEEKNTLAEILKKKVSKRFYRHLKFIQAEFYVQGQPKKLYEYVNPLEEIEVRYKEQERHMKWPHLSSNPKIVYEDDHYLIVDKEPNLLTIPIQANPNSLYQQIVSYLGVNEVHILNRLDRETSGLIVVAKDRYSANLLEPTHQHIVRKYLCLVEGVVSSGGTIINYIAKYKDSNQRYVSKEQEGKLAISHYSIIEKYEDKTLLEFVLETGRTHQIRVHTSDMGHPIVGDTLYGSSIKGQLCLTSYFVEFKDPYSKSIIQKQIKEAWK